VNDFANSLVLARVMTSGIIMSIEKNESEVAGLARWIQGETGLSHVGLFNSVTGAIHGALWGRGIGHGDSAARRSPGERERKFLAWLGIALEDGEDESYALVGPACLHECRGGPPVVVADFSELGFGPCAALATDDELVWRRAERLKIFGAFDLRTMWTQVESAADVPVGVQFNYRLSPLVAGCVRLALARGESR
jgi:hypothetical protein